MTQEEFVTVQNHIDYAFKNPDLLHQAFTRKSYAEENGGHDNEVLEFIGDKVLDLVVVKYLTETFGSYAHDYEDYSAQEDDDEFECEVGEGSLSEMKAQLVQKRMLSARIDKLGFADYLYMGRGDSERHVERQESVKEDLFEAILGAVALDSNWNLEVLENVVEHMLDPEAELGQDEELENYIGLVQDWASETQGELPLYHPEDFFRDYYFRGNNYILGDNMKNLSSFATAYPKRMCSLILPGVEVIFLEAGQTDREARRGAAKAAYTYLKEHDLLPTIRDEIENPNKDDSISQLEILSRRGYFPLPEYVVEETHDNDGNPIWSYKCTIKIKGVAHFTSAKSSSKKDAKKQAAFKMLQHVLEVL